MYKLICMAYDGEYVTEHGTFETIDLAWEHSSRMGSKWYFYTFHFVVTESGKTIIDGGYHFHHLKGKRVKTVQRFFREAPLALMAGEKVK